MSLAQVYMNFFVTFRCPKTSTEKTESSPALFHVFGIPAFLLFFPKQINDKPLYNL